jgi:hypothetical protein
MFNLIISIIAIALVVALAGASLYYGGDAFSQGSSEARAATFINQAQQIQAAATLFEVTQGGEAANIIALTDNGFISAVPLIAAGVGAWDVTNVSDVVFVSSPTNELADAGITPQICDLINENGSGVVFCSVSAADIAATLAAPDVSTGGIAAAANVTVYMAL